MSKKYSNEIKEQAKRIVKETNNYHEAARQTGANCETIRTWCDPILKQKYLKYIKDNKNKMDKYNKEYHQKTKEERLRYHAEHFQNNKEQKYEYIRKKCEREPGFKMRLRLSNRLNDALKVQGIRKATRTMKLVGCTTQQLKEYLQTKFQEGMSWNNYGEWHIDHIIPCTAFDLTEIEEQKKCFHFSNLQPLWKHDNCSKGNKMSQ